MAVASEANGRNPVLHCSYDIQRSNPPSCGATSRPSFNYMLETQQEIVKKSAPKGTFCMTQIQRSHTYLRFAVYTCLHGVWIFEIILTECEKGKAETLHAWSIKVKRGQMDRIKKKALKHFTNFRLVLANYRLKYEGKWDWINMPRLITELVQMN